MKYQALFFEYNVPVGAEVDEDLRLYTTAISRWEFPSLDAFMNRVAHQYPVMTWEPVVDADHKIIKGAAVVHHDDRSILMLVLQSELLDRDHDMINVLLPLDTVSETYYEVHQRLDAKLGKRT